jgi:hypothetical protein
MSQIQICEISVICGRIPHHTRGSGRSNKYAVPIAAASSEA